jgi:large subunit ribosomal protein L25
MSDKVLQVEERSAKGTGDSRRARAQGFIPAVVYGHNDPKHVLVNRREFNATFKHITESEIITLKLGKNDIQVLIKDYQSDIVRGELLHIDFFEIEAGKTLKTHVPLHVHGTPLGVREGGILEAPLHELEIECLPKDLPASIEVDVADLVEAMHVSDLTPPPGVTFLTSPEQLIAAITHARAEVEETEDEEEAVEGEVNEEAEASEE